MAKRSADSAEFNAKGHLILQVSSVQIDCTAEGLTKNIPVIDVDSVITQDTRNSIRTVTSAGKLPWSEQAVLYMNQVDTRAVLTAIAEKHIGGMICLKGDSAPAAAFAIQTQIVPTRYSGRGPAVVVTRDIAPNTLIRRISDAENRAWEKRLFMARYWSDTKTTAPYFPETVANILFGLGSPSDQDVTKLKSWMKEQADKAASRSAVQRRAALKSFHDTVKATVKHLTGRSNWGSLEILPIPGYLPPTVRAILEYSIIPTGDPASVDLWGSEAGNVYADRTLAKQVDTKIATAIGTLKLYEATFTTTISKAFSIQQAARTITMKYKTFHGDELKAAPSTSSLAASHYEVAAEAALALNVQTAATEQANRTGPDAIASIIRAGVTQKHSEKDILDILQPQIDAALEELTLMDTTQLDDLPDFTLPAKQSEEDIVSLNGTRGIRPRTE